MPRAVLKLHQPRIQRAAGYHAAAEAVERAVVAPEGAELPGVAERVGGAAGLSYARLSELPRLVFAAFRIDFVYPVLLRPGRKPRNPGAVHGVYRHLDRAIGPHVLKWAVFLRPLPLPEAAVVLASAELSEDGQDPLRSSEERAELALNGRANAVYLPNTYQN